MTLSGYVSVITGAANGIGRACALKFANTGSAVVIADIDDEQGHAVEQDIIGRGGKALYVRCDVADRLDVKNLISLTVDSFGHIDTLINNAGIIFGADFLDLKEAHFDRVLGVNLKGAFLTGQAVARQMVKQIKADGRPSEDVHESIINMSSINGVLAIPNQLAYVVSKGGMNQLTKAMALSLAPMGIRVNGIGPGSTMTDSLRQLMTDDDARQRILSRTPIGRICEPGEIAEIAAFLASSNASYLTGQTIYADGGRLSQNYAVSVD